MRKLGKTAKSSDVSEEGHSPRSSRSAGKPRTRRRRAVDECRAKPLGQVTYVASTLVKSWLLNEQRKLHARSKNQPDYAFEKLWGLITDPRNLRTAFARVASNKGRRTAGVVGLTVRRIIGQGVDAMLAQTRAELRSGAYRPSPVRRVLIPKPARPGEFRPLGIPTVKDRVVQAAMKNIL